MVIDVKAQGRFPADRRAVQQALDRAKTLPEGERLVVRLGGGTYMVDKVLVVYSGTHLLLSKDTVMKRVDEHRMMLKSECDHVRPQYGQAHDIIIEGGIWDGNVTRTDEYRRMIKFSHARNITLRNTVIRNCSGKHVVAFAGVEGITVSGVRFTGYKGFDGPEHKRKNAEQLHIDGISSDGVSEPGEYPYDNTPCGHVRIEDCIFDGGCCAVGSHYPPFETRSYGFVVRNCVFRNYEYTALNIFRYDGVELTGNTFSNNGLDLRPFDTRFTISGNRRGGGESEP